MIASRNFWVNASISAFFLLVAAGAAAWRLRFAAEPASVVAAAAFGVFLLSAAAAVSAERRTVRRLRLLSQMHVEVNRAISSNEDIGAIYQKILDYLFRVFDKVRFGSVLVLDESGYLSFAAYRGFSEDYAKDFRLALEDSFIYQESGGDIRSARLISKRVLSGLFTRFKPGGWDYRSVISAPLFSEGKLFGLLNLDSDKPRIFTKEDLRIFEELTAQIEVCLLARGRYRKNIERSNIDSLTGLCTRRHFEELFDHVLERSRRYGERFILVIFDADGLKTINDLHGHLAGDLLLRTLADSLRDVHRKSDILGRFGGDEFIAVYHTNDLEAIGRGLEEVLNALRDDPPRWEGKPLAASFCYGLARYPEDGDDLQSLTSAADKELYLMKRIRKGS
jgi:diguanylate cyclase (GGDEF)-like protein